MDFQFIFLFFLKKSEFHIFNFEKIKSWYFPSFSIRSIKIMIFKWDGELLWYNFCLLRYPILRIKFEIQVYILWNTFSTIEIVYQFFISKNSFESKEKYIISKVSLLKSIHIFYKRSKNFFLLKIELFSLKNKWFIQ